MDNEIVTPAPERRTNRGRRQDDVVLVNQADIERETVRVERIKARIAAITNLPSLHAGCHSVAVSIAMGNLSLLVVSEEEFGEFTKEAAMAVDTTMGALSTLRTAARVREKEENDRTAREIARAIADSDRQFQTVQGEEAMRVVQNIQKLSFIQGDSDEIKAALDDIMAVDPSAQRYGLGARMVEMARELAANTLRTRYEQALQKEGRGGARFSVSGDEDDKDDDKPGRDINMVTHELKRSMQERGAILDMGAAMRAAVDEEYGRLTDAADALPPAPTKREMSIAKAVYEATMSMANRVARGGLFEIPNFQSIIANIKEQE